MELHQPDRSVIEARFRAIQRSIVMIQVLLGVTVLMPIYFYAAPKWRAYQLRIKEREKRVEEAQKQADLKRVFDGLWKAPIVDSTTFSAEDWQQVKYGKELIANTAYYLGPKGKVRSISNGMNCQNCHLEAGSKPWGNNYAAVASTYPKYRGRSGSIEDMSKRINDCFERSLNGQGLDEDSREMQAIKAYITYLGKDVNKGDKPAGSGIYELSLPEKALDTAAGKLVYFEKCASCHQKDGGGLIAEGALTYTYPPLWGPHSYNQGAGLFRMSRFAGYVRYNMPQGASFLQPQLTEEEAWNVAGYVNSQPRPALDLSADWPKLEEKPFDHSFGPYADPFTESQHKYGPYLPIKAYYQKKKK